MPKYGLFLPGSSKPAQEYEGDRIGLTDGFVYVFKSIPTNAEKVVAVVKLAEGQSVKEFTPN